MSTAGRYFHIVKLGEGTYGCVYKATERDTGRVIAFKRMVVSSDDEGVPGTAIREILLLQRLRHENIVSLYEVLFDSPKITLVFELCDCDMKQYLETRCQYGRLNPETEVRPVLRQMFAGLSYLHTRSIVHRDLKPQNVFFNIRGPTKMTLEHVWGAAAAATTTTAGFNGGPFSMGNGSAAAADAPASSSSGGGGPALSSSPPPAAAAAAASNGGGGGGGGDATAATAAAAAAAAAAAGSEEAPTLIVKLGDFGLARADNIPVKKYSHEVVTLWYRSPDVLMSSALYGLAVDVWSMGAIFFEMVTGRVLFGGRNEDDQVLRMIRLLGSPTKETWPSMRTYPGTTDRLERVAAFLAQQRQDERARRARQANADPRRRGGSGATGGSGGAAPPPQQRPAVPPRPPPPGEPFSFTEFCLQHEDDESLIANANSAVSAANSLRLPRELWFPAPLFEEYMIVSGFRQATGKEGVHLLRRCLEFEPAHRITAAEVLEHPFLRSVAAPSMAFLDEMATLLGGTLSSAGF